MTLRLLATVATTVAFAMTTFSARAECSVTAPTVWATAKLLSCRAFTVQASTLKMSDLDDRQPDIRLDEPAAEFRGTLVQVLFDEVTGTPTVGSGRDWKRGAVATLFSRQPATEVCRPQKATRLVIDTQCCDTFPRQGSCLVSGLQRVYVNPSDEQMRPVKAGGYFTSGLD